MAVQIPADAWQYATMYGQRFGVDRYVLLAVAKHETNFGTLGAGRDGYDLGFGATDSGKISKYRGRENQYHYAAQWFAARGVKTIQDILAGKAASYATDPGWEAGIARAWKALTGSTVNLVPPSSTPAPGQPGLPGTDQAGNIIPVGNPISNALAVGEFFKKLTEPHMWVRILEVVGGGAAVVAGIFFLARAFPAGRAATDVALMAATKGKAGGAAAAGVGAGELTAEAAAL